MRIFCPAIAVFCSCRSVVKVRVGLLTRVTGGGRRGRRPSGVLLVDLDDAAGADGAATLTDGEPEALLHGDGLDQLHRHLGVVAGQTISVPAGSVTTPVTSVVRK